MATYVKNYSDKKKILIIEDNFILSKTLADNLTPAGFEVIEANDGAVGLARALSTKPDLILLDVLLPKMNGLSVLDALRRDPWGKNVPVIIMSNLDEPKDIATALEGGVEEYLVKTNWKIEDVVKRIQEKLEQV